MRTEFWNGFCERRTRRTQKKMPHAITPEKMGEMKDKAMGLLASKDAQLRQLQAQLEAYQDAAAHGKAKGKDVLT